MTNKRASNITWTVAGLMLALLLAALDQTIVSTAMPTILGELGGLEQFVWVFSAYLIANVVAMPIFGKLGDMYGRKLFFMIGLIVFMVGSALCGTAETMLQLIIYRAVQGIGGGALMPITFAIVFDIFPPEKRGKMQGLFGAVFGISSVLGPLAGAYFTDYVNWQWIFYINLPLGVIAFILIALFYHPALPSNPNQRVDWLGTLVFGASVISLMLGLELGGKEGYPWASVTIIGLFAATVALFVLFLLVEKKAVSPIVPLHLFRKRLFTANMGMSFFYGALMISAATYIPLYIQGVFQGTATASGLVLTPMMLGVVASSMIGGRFIGKTSYRSIMLVSVSMLLVATVLLGTLTTDTPRWLVTMYMIMLGLSIGTSFPVVSISSVQSVSFEFRGVVTSLTTFFRSIGSAVGVTILGMVQSYALNDKLRESMNGSSDSAPVDPHVLLSEQFRASVPKPVMDQLIMGLAESIAFVFQVSISMAAAAFLFVLLMGNARLELSSNSKDHAGRPSKDDNDDTHGSQLGSL
ncbi:MDR family MFS transporter [Paenibacillus sp. YYML68]|uniref:MDR family MFS transporter n=1 Tax=Paenibacillus sp. YYML68 TaxID=2909250 RepID=UPI0024926897|nr:MDR family MFS transporter [Paenibacillus sp. YYML68]